MDYLIIYAHPNPKSFNHAILEEVEKKVRQSGKTYQVRDIYTLTFNPILSAPDFIAFQNGQALPDIKAEQDLIRQAKTLIFIYPIWWFNMPAILKGYIDRVFSPGFAYSTDKKEGLKGLLTDKQVIILNTTGGPEENYKKFGFDEALKTTIEVGTFGLCGMTVVLHKYFYAVPTVPPETRVNMLEEIKQLVF